MILPVTLTFAAVAALLNLWLALRLAPLRVGRRISIGHGGDPLCEARMRAHANYVEYTPFILILIALIEFARGWALGLWIIGAVYMLARILHAFGMERPAPNALRVAGVAVTFVTLVVLAGWALAIAYRLA
jgi:uncharacterized protein